MQVLGDLIRLPLERTSLPLPWWHRAPLGLLNGTQVYVALVESGRVGPNQIPGPELIVSVLDPDLWQSLLMVRCSRRDEPGVFLESLNAVYPLNIVLAESVTLETDNMHEVTLICETSI